LVVVALLTFGVFRLRQGGSPPQPAAGSLTVPAPGNVFGMQLNAITVLTPTNAWAIGTLSGGPGINSPLNAMIFAHYDGAHWSSAPVRPEPVVGKLPVIHLGSFVDLTGLAFSAPNNGWAVGQYVDVVDPQNRGALIYHYDGATWTPAAQSVGVPLTKVAAAPDGQAWAVGNFQTPNTLLHFDGQQWQTLTLPFTQSVHPMDIVMLPNGDGWLIGGIAPTAGVAGSVIARYHNGAWAVQQTIDNTLLSHLSMATDAAGIVTDGQNIYQYDGVTWRLAQLPADWKQLRVDVIGMASATSGWAMADSPNSDTAKTCDLAFLRYTTQGWQTQTLTGIPSCREGAIKAFGFQGDVGWAVGLITAPLGAGQQSPFATTDTTSPYYGATVTGQALYLRLVNDQWQVFQHM
jgi:hypothetical protein